MPAKLHELEWGWDVIYNPDYGVGHIQNTAASESRAVRFTATPRGVVRLPSRHAVPARIVARLQRWIADGAPGVALPDPD